MFLLSPVSASFGRQDAGSIRAKGNSFAYRENKKRMRTCLSIYKRAIFQQAATLQALKLSIFTKNPPKAALH